MQGASPADQEQRPPRPDRTPGDDARERSVAGGDAEGRTVRTLRPEQLTPCRVRLLPPLAPTANQVPPVAPQGLKTGLWVRHRRQGAWEARRAPPRPGG